jgi:HPt (histidine-containing phosphotransfer) domain-containing protein
MIVNSSTIDSYREVMGEDWGSFVTALIDIFMDSVPKYLSEMNAAYEARDQNTIKHVAHTLKSSASTIGADNMFLICAEIENMARVGDFEGSRVMISQLERVLLRVFQELEDLKPEA